MACFGSLMRRLNLVLPVAAAVLMVPCASAQDWPGWRGPTGMGQADVRDLPLIWGGKSHDNVRWKTPLIEDDALVKRDQNQSSPIVVKGRVVVTLSYWPAGVPATQHPEHHVLCFRTTDGRRLWDTQIPPGPWLLKDLRGGYTAPTPASDGERLYVLFGSAVLAGLDLDGKLLWRQEIVPHAFDVAIGTSPVVHNGKVLLACDLLKQSKASSLRAYDGKTGTLLWQQQRPDVDWAHATPVLSRLHGRTQLLLGTANALQGVDPDDGTLLWWCHSTQRIGDTVSPVVGAGLVYGDSGRGGPALAVDPAGSGDLTKTGVRWKLASMPEGFSSPVVVGDLLYRLHSPGVLHCLKMTSGESLYRERLEGIDPAVSPIATADGRIYCASAGKSYVVQAGPTFTILGSGDLGDAARASPAVADGMLFLKGTRNLYCVDKK
jgi:outer membrane protein assembly factor BamB